MIFSREQAIQKLIDPSKHKNYDYVKGLTAEYQDLFLCKDLKRFSKRYRANETKEQHEQRMSIYISLIPSLIAEVDRDFNKPLLSDKIVKGVDADSIRVTNKSMELASNFHDTEQGQGVDAFLQDKWAYYIRFDPNAIITIERDNDNLFPFVFESDDVINYERKAGKLVWFIGISEDVFYLYDASGIHTLREVITNDDVSGELVFVNQRRYDYSFYRNDRAIRGAKFAGVLRDAVTKNETYISIFHFGLPYLKKEIQLGSEFDLTMRKHVFPQKSIIGRACTGTEESRCLGGQTMDGEVCKKCNGTGTDLTVHDSTQELIILNEEDDKQQQLYPKDIIHYFSPPVELVKFQEEYQDKIHKNFRNSIFSQVLKRASGDIKTATEIRHEANNLLDTLYPYMRKYSNLWMHIMDEIILLAGSGKSYFKFPSVIFPQTDTEILEELKVMQDSGAPQFILIELQKDWFNQKYSTNPDRLVRMEVRAKFQPFFGKTEDEIRLILGGG